MKRSPILFLPIVLLLPALAAACSTASPLAAPLIPSPTSIATPTPSTFTDPFAYCAAVGTMDKPDARYTGPQVPDEVVNGFKKAAGLEASTEPLDMLRKSTVWRCMDSKVYACNFGANLPCDAKANTNATPSAPMQEYCSANPNSDVIPMSVTGHDTIYDWRCANDKPEVLRQVGQVDAAGYIAEIWYAIEPVP